jgi:hypothetical protein
MIHSVRPRLRVVLVAVRFWPFAVFPGCAVQMRMPLNNCLQDDARLNPNVKFSIVPVGLKPGRTSRMKGYLCHD